MRFSAIAPFRQMGWSKPWCYKFCFSLMIIYMCVTCIIIAILLWHLAIPNEPSNAEITKDDIANLLVPTCAIKHKLMNDSLHNCSIFGKLKFQRFVANGWTKVVHQAKWEGGKSIAVKSVNLWGKDLTDCLKKDPLLKCYNRAAEKQSQEIMMLRSLHHSTLVEMQYYCLRNEGDNCAKQAILITELGEPLTNMRLLRMTWIQRLNLIKDLIKILHFAEHNPLGTLGMADLRRQQFILVESKRKIKKLKLADLDDIIIGEPTCSTSSDCNSKPVTLLEILLLTLLTFYILTDLNITIPCIADRCHGYNAKVNIRKSFREFGPYIFIVDGVPYQARESLKKLEQLWCDPRTSTEELQSAAALL